MIDLETITENSFGIFGSFRRLGATALHILRNRLELIAIELKEEKQRAIGVVILAGAMLFLAFMTVVALMFTLTFVFWEQKVAVMAGFCGLFFLGAIASYALFRSKLKTPPFAETINQLKKDKEWLQGK